MIHKLSTTQHKTQQNKSILVQSPLMTLGQETRLAYCTTLPSRAHTGGWTGTMSDCDRCTDRQTEAVEWSRRVQLTSARSPYCCRL